MRTLTVTAILLSATLLSLSQIPFQQPTYPLSPGHIDNPTVHDEIPTRYLPLFKGFPFAYYALVGIGLLLLRIWRELDYELRQDSEPEA